MAHQKDQEPNSNVDGARRAVEEEVMCELKGLHLLQCAQTYQTIAARLLHNQPKLHEERFWQQVWLKHLGFVALFFLYEQG